MVNDIHTYYYRWDENLPRRQWAHRQTTTTAVVANESQRFFWPEDQRYIVIMPSKCLKRYILYTRTDGRTPSPLHATRGGNPLSLTQRGWRGSPPFATRRALATTRGDRPLATMGGRPTPLATKGGIPPFSTRRRMPPPCYARSVNSL